MLSVVVADAGAYRISNGAGLVLDNTACRVLAYAGSVDFLAEQGQIDGVRILRQPGSTLKSFLYALALESRFSPASPLPDIPMEFGRQEVYVPENYNNRFSGPVRLSTALGSSLNVPAVYTTQRLGVAAFRERLLAAGFDSLKTQTALGASQDKTEGIWMGNFSGNTVIGAPGSSLPAQVVVKVLSEVATEQSFSPRVLLEPQAICSLSGQVPTAACPYVSEELFIPGTTLNPCSWHRDGRTFYPPEYADWLRLHGSETATTLQPGSPEFLQPADGAVLYYDPTMPLQDQAITIKTTGQGAGRLYVNDRLIREEMLPFVYYHPLEKGRWSLVLESARESRRIFVVVK